MLRDREITSTIVNISFIGQFGVASRGSGTMIHSSGVILTNAHIIPANYGGYGGSYQCIVSIPDPATGEPRDLYYGSPMVVDALSKKYDLAFIKIEGTYEEEGSKLPKAVFPSQFVSYDDAKYCRNNGELALGDKVRVYGYPEIGGGKNLIITEGIVSGFDRERGYIFTSAKMSHGNSGGLAVDANGCMIGIPTRVNRDNLESLGILLSNSEIERFLADILKMIDEDKGSH